MFPIDSIINYHKFSDFKQHKYIALFFKMCESVNNFLNDYFGRAMFLIENVENRFQTLFPFFLVTPFHTQIQQYNIFLCRPLF